MLSLPNPQKAKHILLLSFPMMLSMLSENLMSIIDTLMVSTLGTSAIAALGISGFLYFVALSTIMGFNSGIQTLTAWRFGEKRFSEMGQVLNTGLTLCFLVGIPIFLVMQFFSPFFLSFIIQDPEVLAIAVPFYKWRVVGLLFICITFSFNGYWNAINKGHYYLGMLGIGHGTNIFFNYCFIFGNFGFPELGATGAGMASALSLCFSVLYCLFFGLKDELKNGFLRHMPDFVTIKALCKVAIPISFEKFLFALALTLAYKIVGMVGTQAVAGHHIVVQLLLLGVLPAMGLGMGTTTLVGQAIGEKNIAAAKDWASNAAKVSGIYGLSVGALVALFAPFLVGLFIKDPYTQNITVIALRFYCMVIWMEAIYWVIKGALIGTGDSLSVMIYTTLHMYFIYIPFTYLFGPFVGWGLPGIWFGEIFIQSVAFLTFLWIWRRGKWVEMQEKVRR